MSDLTVKLLVAIIAATAVLAAALIGLWKDRKRRRDILLQDLEILDKLPSPSLNHMILAAHVDKRVLLLSLEDRIGVYVAAGFVLIALFFLLTIVFVVGATTDNMPWSFVAAGTMLIMAALLIAYRPLKVRVTDYLERQIKETGHSKASELIRENIAAGVRGEVIEKIEKQLPEPYRDQLMAHASPAVDTEIDKTVDKLVSSLLSGNRYSDWSPKLSSGQKNRTVMIKFKFYTTLVRILAALMRRLDITPPKLDLNDERNPAETEANEPSTSTA